MKDRRTPNALLLLLLAAIAVGVGAEVFLRSGEDPSGYYAAALRNANISEMVTVNGVPYAINDGTVTSSSPPVTASDRASALRLAYALVLARRSPLMGIAGVDPGSLAKAASSLATASASLSNMQATESDALLVRSALYPVDFLEKLGALEQARLQFISSGSDTDERSYELALGEAIASGQEDAQKFEKGFDTEAGTSPFRFPSLGGTITDSTMRSSIGVVIDRFDELRSFALERERCLNGDLSSCPSSAELELQVPEQPATVPAPRTPAMEYYNGMYSEVALSQSSCLAQEPAPYVFGYGDFDGESRIPVVYLSELYFSPIADVNGTTASYLHDTLGIDYSLINPLEFYICPDVLRDIGSVSAVMATVGFAREYPSYAPAEAARLLSSNIYAESDAIAYVRSAATRIEAQDLPESSPALTEFENVLDQWRERSGEMDALVGGIAQVDTQDVELRAKGVPFSVDARTLFLTHSAFPSLFLAENEDAGSSVLSLRDTLPSDLTPLQKNYIPYSELILTVPAQKITHDLNAFLSFEGLSIPQ